MSTPLQRIRDLHAQRAHLKVELLEAVERAREEGRSWGEIGVAMGISRAGAFQFYKRHRARDTSEGEHE